MKKIITLSALFILCATALQAQFKASEQVDIARGQTTEMVNPQLVLIVTMNGTIEGLPLPINLDFNVSNGQCAGWAYMFKDDNEYVKTLFVYDFYGTKVPYELPEGYFTGLPAEQGASLEDKTWMDSDAMAVALTGFQGYQDYLTENPQATLHYIVLTVASGNENIPDGTAFWLVEVQSNNNNPDIYIEINGETGEAFISQNITPDPLKADPDNIIFGDVRVGMIKDTIVTLTNSGEIDITINSATVNNERFSLVQIPDSIEAGASANLMVRFQPDEENYQAGQIQIEYTSDEDRTKSIVVVGNGIIIKEPRITVEGDEIIFGETIIGQSKTDNLIIKNTGDTTLTIQSVEIESEYDVFSLDGFSSGNIEPGDSTEINISYSPENESGHTGQIVISSNSVTDSILKIDIRGTGIIPESVEDSFNHNNIIVMPNPVEDRMKIAIPVFLNIKFIEIYDLTGKKVYTEEHNSTGDIEINMSALRDGPYCVCLIADNKVYTGIILKSE